MRSVFSVPLWYKFFFVFLSALQESLFLSAAYRKSSRQEDKGY
jgi:hypothetical protein